MGSRSPAEETLRTRLHQQEVVAALGKRAVGADDLDELLADASAAVADALDVDYGAVFELTPGGAELRLRRGVGWQDGLAGDATVPAAEDTHLGATLTSADPVVVDFGAETRVSGGELFADHDVVSGVGVVIRSGESAWGVLSAYATDRRDFADHDEAFVRDVADVLGSAVEEEATSQHLDEVYSRITDAFFGLDENWNFTYVNDRASEWIDPENQGLEGERIWEALPEAVDSQFEEEYRRAMKTKEPTTFEAYYPEPLDSWFEVHAYPSESGLSVYFRNVTERKEREQERELFRTLLDRSTDSVLVVDPDSAAILDVNETACRRLDYDRDELTALSVLDIEEEFADVDEWRSHVEEVRSEGTVTVEGEHRRKDGTTYPVEVNVTHAELDQEYMLAVARDVTRRRERERELEQYRALTQAANDVIVTIDERSVIRSINPTVADVFGYDHGELIGESLTVLMPDEMMDGHREAIERYLETGEQTLDWDYLELPGQHADGSEIPLAVSFSEVTIGDERFFTGIMRDITEREEIQRQLEASNERLEQFAYVASHDLQEPLRMITSYLTLIERRYADELDEDGREFIEFAVDGADRMREMIEALLEYSRVETQGDPFEPVDLNGVLADVRADLQIQIEESGAEITAADLPAVEGDVSQLRQLFQNLLDNAIEYSGEGQPRVAIDAERDGGWWEVSVSDEGIGIDAGDADRIFEVFQRLHAPDEHPGTGIGLALCERIVERHGGEIWVESEPGEGSTFRFTLPAAGDGDD